MRPRKPLGIDAPASSPRSRTWQLQDFASISSPLLLASFCSLLRTEEHHFLGVWKSTSPASKAPTAATTAWKRLGELAAAKRRPANAFVSAFCFPACMFLPRAGMFEHLRRWRNNTRQESRTPLTGLRKNRTINAKLQSVEHRKWY